MREYWQRNAGKLFGNYYDMSSLVENKIEKFINDDLMAKIFLQYNKNQISRVYPKGNELRADWGESVFIEFFPCTIYTRNYEQAIASTLRITIRCRLGFWDRRCARSTIRRPTKPCRLVGRVSTDLVALRNLVLYNMIDES